MASGSSRPFFPGYTFVTSDRQTDRQTENEHRTCQVKTNSLAYVTVRRCLLIALNEIEINQQNILVWQLCNFNVIITERKARVSLRLLIMLIFEKKIIRLIGT